MKLVNKILSISTAVLSVTLLSTSGYAQKQQGYPQQQQGYNQEYNQGYNQRPPAYNPDYSQQGHNQEYSRSATTQPPAYNSDYVPQNQGYEQQDPYDGQNYDQQNQYNTDEQQDPQDTPPPPAGPALQVQVQYQMSGEYQQLFNKEKDKYEIFLRGLDNIKDSTKGTKPSRIDLDAGQAQFDDKAGEQPKALLVALSKKGNSYQYFCHGKNVKDGVIKGFPQSITIKLSNGNKPYKTAAGTLRNDSYPNCEIVG